MMIKSIGTIIIFLSMNHIYAQSEILLWPNGAPGSEGKSTPEHVRINEPTGDHVVSQIHHPSITPFIPAIETNTGIAVIVAPGGGHRELWIDHEGYNIAKKLQQHGIAAFVLKYRLAKDSSSTYSIDVDELADIQRAIQLVKSRAEKWKINPNKLGVMGFSAGGEVAALAAMKFTDGNVAASDPLEKFSSRPAFQALIYPGNAQRFEVVPNAPPLFILGGYEDRTDIAVGIAEVYLKYKKKNVPAELHIYANAGHGFGLRSTAKGAVSTWLDRFVDWVNEVKM